ncbi:MAG: hypothetical protein ACJ73S_21955 [Mycobacteriales bacterium]
MNPARLIATGAAATLLPLSVACTTDHPAHPKFTHSPTPTPHPTDPQSRAATYARQYFTVLTAAIKSRDPTHLQAISGADCVVCHQEIDFVNGIKAKNQTTDITDVSIEDVKLVVSNADSVAALVTIRQPAYHVYDSQQQVVNSESAYHVQFQMGFRFDSTGMTLVFRMDALVRNPA